MNNKLLIATNNPAKVQEISSVLADLNLKCLSPADLNITDKPDESANTLENNALAKAKFYADKTGLIALGDDSGLEIDALNGQPGIYVRRWPGYEATDQELIDYCLAKMKDIPEEKRGAQFRSIICVYNPKNQEKYFFEGIIRGMIALKPFPEHQPGYPFDTLFYFPDLKKYLAEIKLDQRQNLSHRAKAVQASKNKIKELFKK